MKHVRSQPILVHGNFPWLPGPIPGITPCLPHVSERAAYIFTGGAKASHTQTSVALADSECSLNNLMHVGDFFREGYSLFSLTKEKCRNESKNDYMTDFV